MGQINTGLKKEALRPGIMKMWGILDKNYDFQFKNQIVKSVSES